MNKPATEFSTIGAARANYPALERWTYMDLAGRGVLSRGRARGGGCAARRAHDERRRQGKVLRADRAHARQVRAAHQRRAGRNRLHEEHFRRPQHDRDGARLASRRQRHRVSGPRASEQRVRVAQPAFARARSARGQAGGRAHTGRRNHRAHGRAHARRHGVDGYFCTGLSHRRRQARPRVPRARRAVPGRRRAIGRRAAHRRQKIEHRRAGGVDAKRPARALRHGIRVLPPRVGGKNASGLPRALWCRSRRSARSVDGHWKRSS